MAIQSFADFLSRSEVLKIAAVLSSSVLSYWLLPLLYGFLYAPTRKIPGPFWARITRWNEFRKVIKGDSNLEYIRLHEKLGPVVRMGPNRYSFSDPADFKIIYGLGSKLTKTEYYDPLGSDDLEKDNLFTMKDPIEHNKRRRKVSSLYTMSTMKNYEPAVDKMTRVCIRKMHQFADEGRTISLPDFIQYYAFDVIGEITFNKSFDMMEKEGDDTGMIKGLHFGNRYLAHVGLIIELHRLFTRFQRLRGIQEATLMTTYTANQIAENRDANRKDGSISMSDTFLAKLLSLQAENRVELPNIMDAVGGNIAAGSDTTAITLTSALYHLYTNSDKLAKLRDEIDTLACQNLASDPVTWQEAQNMPYLQAVIQESLRMHPAIGTMLPRRVPIGGLELAGTYFPEGTEVGSNAWVLHYNKAIYGPDAHVYRPERWLEPKVKGDLRESMMFSFGAGSRTCIGKNISLLEMTKVLPQIVRHFDISVVGDGKMHTYCAWFVYLDFKVQLKRRATE